MALRESMLEEFGLGPVWVRRGMRGCAGAADAAQALPSWSARGIRSRPAPSGLGEAGAGRHCWFG